MHQYHSSFRSSRDHQVFGTVGIPALCVVILFASIAFCSGSLWADERQPLQPAGQAFDGDLLVTPMMDKETVLLGANKTEQHVWPSQYFAAGAARLLPDGSILRIANSEIAKPFAKTSFHGGRVQRIAWDGTVLWDFWNAATYHMVCGDVIQLPNGNILMSVVEYKERADCLNLGCDPRTLSDLGLFSPGLMEFQPNGPKGGRLVWRWSLWDHLSQSRNSTFPNYDAAGTDKTRANVEATLRGMGFSLPEISYEAGSNVVIITVPRLGEIWALDHSTSIDEAKTSHGGKFGSGGAFLARWRPSMGTDDKARLHLVSAEPRTSVAGNLPSLRILKYSKRDGAGVNTVLTSVAFRNVTDAAATVFDAQESAQASWSYTPDSVLDSPSASTAGPEGFWFMTSGRQGKIRMVDSAGKARWEYTNQRGKILLTTHTLRAGEKCCLPANELNKQTSPDDVKTEAAPVASTRYYPAGFLERNAAQAPAVGPQSE